MRQMNDDKIKKIIQDNVKKPEIKLSAAQILAMHEERQRTKAKPKRTPFFSRSLFKYSLGFLSAALVIGLTVYLLRDTVIPPIISTSQDPETSETSSESPTTSSPTSEPRQNTKIPHGKEGEFVFMSTSALNYAPAGSITPSGAIKPLARSSSSSLTDEEKVELEATLDQTLPLVDDFFNADKGFNYARNQGSFAGKYGTYAREYIINEYTRIIGDIEIEEEDTGTEMELDGEIIIYDTHFHFEGETEIDTTDNETDISIKIEYDEDSYLEIQSENDNGKQTFEYKLYLDGDEKYYVEIESYNESGHGGGPRHCVDVKAKYNNIDYEFVITKRNGKFMIEYDYIIIIAHEIEDKKYSYSYE